MSCFDLSFRPTNRLYSKILLYFIEQIVYQKIVRTRLAQGPAQGPFLDHFWGPFWDDFWVTFGPLFWRYLQTYVG